MKTINLSQEAKESMKYINLFLLSLLIFFADAALALFNPHTYPTQVIHFQPTIPQNGKVQRGSCWSESIAAPRSGAWRCGVGSAIYDPCFTAANGSVVCGINPLTYEEGFVLQLTQPLPNKKSSPNTYSLQPITGSWLLKLSDGSVCAPFTGNLPVVDQIPLKYSCSDSQPCAAKGVCLHQTGLSLYTMQTGRVWTATKITYSTWPVIGAKIEKTHIVPIVTVWQ